jgi:L-fuconate dehydratase
VPVVTGLDVHDLRFPTSRELDGSDAMNPDPDYSAAYVVLVTSAGPQGHGFAFTIGRGNEVQAAAIRALEQHVVGRDVEQLCDDLGGFARSLTGDSQLRWLGPEKGVMHMAIGAVVNAAWDLAAKRAGLPVWQLLSRMSPEQIVDLVDFRYLTDALTRDEALDLLRAAEPGRAARTEHLLAAGYPAYTTSPGWLGYSDEKLVRLAREAVADGFAQIKLKVGADLDDDLRRLAIARAAVGPDVAIAVDANQRWDVAEAVRWGHALAPYGISWIEEPTSPDDILGHAAIAHAVAPVPVATGEHVQNRVVFKQLLQAQALSVLQIDACRVGGVNENVAILLLAAKFGVRVCPHAGGVGLCELVQHLSMFDYVAVSGSLDGRMIEYVGHLHEHFLDPVEIRGGHYVAPRSPGFGAQMHERSIADHRFPDGRVWRELAGSDGLEAPLPPAVPDGAVAPAGAGRAGLHDRASRP